jgi:hypothetical protein
LIYEAEMIFPLPVNRAIRIEWIRMPLWIDEMINGSMRVRSYQRSQLPGLIDHVLKTCGILLRKTEGWKREQQA